MNQKRITILALGLGILILGMLFIQVNLLIRSAEIQKKQFQQKVNLALCSAVEKISKDQDVCDALSSCSIGPGNGTINLLGSQDMNRVEQVIRTELEDFGIQIPFKVGLGETKSKDQFQATSNVLPDLGLVNVFLEFPTREDFIRSELKGMFLISFLLVILIMGVFFFALRSLSLQQKAYNLTVDHIDTLSHQLKTPINNISLGLKLLSREVENGQGSQTLEYLGMIQNESNKLKERVEKSLGTGSLEPLSAGMDNDIRVHDLIQKVLENFKVRIDESNAIVEIEETDPEMFIKGNPSSMEMALNALVDNSLKFSTGQPKLSFRAWKEGSNSRISLQDNGVGIPKPEIFRVQEKHFRGNNGENREGHGIGLYSSKKIVENHGGKFLLKSKEGIGTEIILEFTES